MSLVIPFPADHRRAVLEIKLKRELASTSRLFAQSFYEDIHSVLCLNDWNEALIPALIQTPNLLEEVALALHKDDIFAAFFEARVIDLTLERIKKV